MFAFIEGLIDYISDDLCVIDAGGFGINVFVSSRTVSVLPGIGEHIKLYTHTSVREDGISLYGFDNREDLGIFKRLISVSGVGPKGALGILSVFDSNSLRLAIIDDDAKAISKAPGIGLKTAQKICLELKDKISITDDEIIRSITNGNQVSISASANLSSEMQDAIAALTSLGFNMADAKKAIIAIEGAENMESGDLMSLALKSLYK